MSIVAFDPSKDEVKRSKRERKRWGNNPLLVRARVKQDIEQLKPYWSKLKIEADGSADYKYRAIVPRQRVGDFVFNKMLEIDYDSHFKEVVKDRAPAAAGRYEAMLSVWNALAKIQDTAPYAGAKWWESYGVGKGASQITGTGALCAAFIEFKGVDNRNRRRWCVLDAGHQGACSFPDEGDFDELVAEYAASQSDNMSYDEDTESIPNTVATMCRALMSKEINTIYVDEATPYATYDLWVKADQDYVGPMLAEDVINLLWELADEYVTVPVAREQYVEAACDLMADYDKVSWNRKYEPGDQLKLTVDRLTVAD